MSTNDPEGRGRPTLSVVMPNYNHSRYLAEAIESIATQSRKPDEFLILDDASTDDSLRIMEEYRSRFPQIRVLRNEKNLGVVGSNNRLFAEARGDYIFAAAVDDIRLPGFFEAAMDLAQRYPQAGLIFGRVGIVLENGRQSGLIDVHRWHEPLYADPQRFLREYLESELASHSPCSGTIYRADAFREVGCYRPELGSWSDTFAVRAIGLKYGVCHIPQEVVRFRKSIGSFSHAAIIQPRKQLDLIARATALMRSPAFRDRFPDDHVRRWRRAYRRLVVWNDFLGDDRDDAPRPGFLLRNLRRLPRLPRALSLSFYRPNRYSGIRGGESPSMTFGAAGEIDVRAMLKPGFVRMGYYTRPSLLIIGAAKCGTTALHRYLCQHPLIRPAWDKEMHFFDQDVSYRRGLAWYHTRFPLPHKLPRGGVTFEATPDYLYFSRCAARIHRYDPSIKLIVILREPVERAYSFWNMLRNFHAEGGRSILENIHRFDPPIQEAYRMLFAAERFLDFDEFISRELENTGHDGPEIQANLVQYGLYAAQLKRYLQLFDRQQLLVLDSRLLFTETRRVLDQTTDFIGLPRCQWDANIDRRVFDLPYASEMNADTRTLLRDFYRPHNAELCELLGEDFGW